MGKAGGQGVCDDFIRIHFPKGASTFLVYIYILGKAKTDFGISGGFNSYKDHLVNLLGEISHPIFWNECRDFFGGERRLNHH